ncbi:NrsF family protein [Rhizobium ruizarguesonis]
MTKIDDLIETLASDLIPVRRHALRARFALVLTVGLIGAIILLLVSLGLRPQLHPATMAAFWIKFSYTAVMMVTSVIGLYRVARPDCSVAEIGWVPVAAFAAIVVLAVGQLVVSPTGVYPALIFGYTALFCPVLIIAFGLPAFFANMWFLSRAAPLDSGVAGFVAGACAGAVGGWVYSWACVESGIPFIGIWYTLGILISGILGRVVGKNHLRW